MADQRQSPLNLNVLLAAVEAAAPVAAADVVGDALTEALGARNVSFLIADYSGRSLIRLSHVEAGESTDSSSPSGRERGETVSLTNTPQGRALEEQEVQIVEDGALIRLYAPVTSRGEAIGVLELTLDAPLG